MTNERKPRSIYEKYEIEREKNKLLRKEMAKRLKESENRRLTRKEQLQILTIALLTAIATMVIYGLATFYIPDLVVIPNIPIIGVLPLDVRQGVTMFVFALCSLVISYVSVKFFKKNR